MSFGLQMTLGAIGVTLVFLAIATWLGRDVFFCLDENDEEDEDEI